MHQRTKRPIEVMSLNHYIMGHATYQNILEKTFREHIPEVEFYSLHLTDYFKSDLLGRVIYWFLKQQLPGADKADYDFHRFRTEWANSFFARRCLEKALKNYQPDVIHIHTQAIAYLAVPLFKKYASVVSIDYTHALLAKEHPYPASITYQPIIAIEKKCFTHAAHIITWSERARNSVISDYGISPKKVTAIAPPVPLEFFTKIIPRRTTREKLPRLLFVGNDFQRKGGEDVLNVFLESCTNICELDIVTNSDLNLPVLPNLRVHRGVRPLSTEILELYQNADIFVMPTHEDCYPMVFIEAMGAGLPSIGTTVMGVPELVQNGINGLTIKAGDRTALKQAIIKLVENPELRLSMGEAGRKIAQEKYDAVSNCDKIAEIFANSLCR
ncbi:glycosyltransferase family 4 protein [Aerosakkonemataceae cyanobacterium BLCC-F154]|uniref:Glycosyltransferase family 4 protein n=1 Tax=Floridaenema fluviatile BLCC-F154 TaxID=3153640 RepID=A0ABV4Y9F7_9CYAN